MTHDEVATFMVGIDHRPWSEQMTLIEALLTRRTGELWSEHFWAPAMSSYIKRNHQALNAYLALGEWKWSEARKAWRIELERDV